MDDSNEGDEWRPWIEICSPRCESPVVSEKSIPPPWAAWSYASPLNLDSATSTLSDAEQSPDTTEFYTLNYADPDKFERETMSYFPWRSNHDQLGPILQSRVAGVAHPPRIHDRENPKHNLVDDLTFWVSFFIETVWPQSDLRRRGILPLRTYIEDILRRSRTSYSTLQVTLYYLILVKPHISKARLERERLDAPEPGLGALLCGRRMFLSALILASKYLQDRNYSNRAWSKISRLNNDEINTNEFLFLYAIDWRLHFNVDLFERWTDTVFQLLPAGLSRNWFDPEFKSALKWIILRIKPDLSNTEDIMIPVPQTFRESKRKNPWAAEEVVVLQKKRAHLVHHPSGFATRDSPERRAI